MCEKDASVCELRAALLPRRSFLPWEEGDEERLLGERSLKS